jgi:predicted metalloprotease with PDZ domain
VPEKTFIDEGMFTEEGDLLPHEFTHSWNGKYRRPAGLATPNYQMPMQGNLLWVYEGLTNYLGDVLAARSGIWSPEVFRDRLATIAADLNNARPGRTWRDLQDTATAAQILYSAGGAFDNWRRDVDYYSEGDLLWLEVDATIREKSHGTKSLNDFLAAFEGLGGNTPPKVVPYTFENVVAGLNAVVPNDWAAFLRTRLDSNEFHAPEMAGIDALSGYKLTFTDKPNYWSTLEESDGSLNARYSIGLTVGSTGAIDDVIVGGVADKAGLAPGFQIIAVNGRAFTPGILRAAIKNAKDSGPAISLIVENTGYFKTISMDYHDGEKYPQLERVDSIPDRLDDILQPLTK